MTASILQRPETFDRVDRVKQVAGQQILPGDECLWILGDVLRFEIDGMVRVIPRGFTTDGASVPWWGERLTGWAPWSPPQRWAGIVHDWLYCDRGTHRKFADRVFRDILTSERAPWIEQTLMYLAVRVGGGPAYRTDQAEGPRIFE